MTKINNEIFKVKVNVRIGRDWSRSFEDQGQGGDRISLGWQGDLKMRWVIKESEILRVKVLEFGLVWSKSTLTYTCDLVLFTVVFSQTLLAYLLHFPYLLKRHTLDATGHRQRTVSLTSVFLLIVQSEEIKWYYMGDKFELIPQKGVLPYNYVTSREILQFTELPNKECFLWYTIRWWDKWWGLLQSPGDLEFIQMSNTRTIQSKSEEINSKWKEKSRKIAEQ